MKLPSWIRPATATTAELEAQRDAAGQAHASAVAASGDAIASFDLDPSTEKALLAAKDAERLAAEHLARAERLLAAGQQRDAEEQRTADEARIVECRKEAGRLAEAVAGKLADAEFAAIEKLAEVRLERLQAARHEAGLLREAAALSHHRHGTHLGSEYGGIPGSTPIAERIQRRLQELTNQPEDHDRSRILRQLTPRGDAY